MRHAAFAVFTVGRAISLLWDARAAEVVARWVTAVAPGGTGPRVVHVLPRQVTDDLSSGTFFATADAEVMNKLLAAEGCPSPTMLRARTAQV